MKRILGIALIRLAIYIPLVLFAGLADRLILFPTTGHIDAGRAIRKMIPFQNGNLEIWTAQSQLAKVRAGLADRAGLAQYGQPDVFVLRFYGNADRADRWVELEAEMWDRRAVEVWGVNYPGFGGSTGPAQLSRIASSALVAFDALKQTAGDRPIVVFGASIGTTAALHIAAQRPVTGLIFHNPPAMKQMAIRQFGWWNLWLLAGPVAAQIPRELDNVANAKHSRAPAIFLLAERDEIVAPRFQRLVVDAYAGEKRVVRLAGASHNSPVQGAAIADLHHALEWLLPRNTDPKSWTPNDTGRNGI
jgi:pimeloyl-ACP methyl ester carboxylesterase